MILTSDFAVPNAVPSGVSGTALGQCPGTVSQLGTACPRHTQVSETIRKSLGQSWDNPEKFHSCPNSPRSLERGLEADTVSKSKMENAE